jgi:ABC-type multidrug transport system ATPase subunit
LLARLIDPTGGRITIGGTDIASVPEAVTGRRIAYVGASAQLFSASIGDNLFYGLKHRPTRDADYDDDLAAARAEALAESARAGNTTRDVFADWIDYSAADVDSLPGLTEAAVRALSLAEMVDDVYLLGLRGTIDPAAHPDLAERVLRARSALHDRLADPDIASLVEPFDVETYNTNATVAENLLFGTPVGDTFDMERLAENEYVTSVLSQCGLTDDLLAMGHEVASTMVEIFSDLPPEHEFFEQFSFIRADDLPAYKELIGRIDREKLSSLSEDERRMLMSLPFKLIPARHALGLVDDAMRLRLLEARRSFTRDLPDDLKPAVEFFSSDRYNAATTLQDNILFGKLAYGQAQAASRIGALISEVIDELDLRAAVISTGLGFHVGIGGSRLSAAQRQKLAIARAVLKRPDILIVSEATAALDGPTQNKITENLLAEFQGRGLIWSLHRPSVASQFDRILVMRGGRVVEQGKYDELDQAETHFKTLIAAE